MMFDIKCLVFNVWIFVFLSWGMFKVGLVLRLMLGLWLGVMFVSRFKDLGLMI